MRVVALDASLRAVSVAAGTLAPDGRWASVASNFALRTTGHAEALMPMLASTVAEARLAFTDIERVIVTQGPGGFTGVRAGVAAARALALATGCELIGISTLDALVVEARAQGIAGAIAVAVDARRAMVFYADYAEGQDDAEPLFLSIADAATRCTRGGFSLVGSGAGLVAAHTGSPVLHGDLEPAARSFAPLALSRPSRGTVRPLYLRPPDAKAQASFVLPRANA